MWYVESECKTDSDCAVDKACINEQCIEVCSIRGSCGFNALCEPVIHRAVCSCPQCHKGDPTVSCLPDPDCQPTMPKTPMKCSGNPDCPGSLSCLNGQCTDPCTMGGHACEPNKKCQVREHRPVCVCKYGFSLNENGILGCAPAHPECRTNTDCSSDLVCQSSQCVSPCTPGICPEDKQCLVLNHRPLCVCTKNCNPSVTICFNDNGCPSHLACKRLQCIDPCVNATCPQGAPCSVEDHKPVCRFCPQGYTGDPSYGCIEGKIHQILEMK